MHPMVSFRPLLEEEERLSGPAPVPCSAPNGAHWNPCRCEPITHHPRVIGGIEVVPIEDVIRQAEGDFRKRLLDAWYGSGGEANQAAVADTITLPRPVALLLADLLDRASDAFSVHSCNDYTFPDEAEPARQAILRAYATWNRSPDVPAYPGDDALMALGAAILRDPSILGDSQ